MSPDWFAAVRSLEKGRPGCAESDIVRLAAVVLPDLEVWVPELVGCSSSGEDECPRFKARDSLPEDPASYECSLLDGESKPERLGVTVKLSRP